MTTKRRELIDALIGGLNIEEDIYAIETVSEKTEHLQESQYLDFYQTVMAENTYGNGVKAVIKVAEQFKPVNVDLVEVKAKELIEFVHSMNHTIFENAKMSGRTFEDELKGTKFLGLRDKDKAILNQVKPYCEYKQLISNISCYGTSLEQLKAFKSAVEYSESYSGMIECIKVQKMVEQKR